MEKTARVIEVFPSIQGEGVYAGRRHLFVRFWNCSMACRYCDTDYRGPYQEVTQAALLGEVEEFVRRDGPFHAVSLTGGEPLLWVRFLRDWLPRLKALSQTTYLETNGTLPASLEELLPWTDIVAMDLKPPSATGDRPFWQEHELFLRKAHEAGRDVFVKVVVTEKTEDLEVDRACRLVASVNREIPLVLQPVTPWGDVREGPLPEQVDRWKGWASEQLADVRVVPQMHRVWGVR